MTALDDWTADACRALGLDPNDVDVPLVLDLARDVAHGVLRPAAPLSAYLLGFSVGRGADPKTAADALTSLAAEWSARRTETPQDDQS
jgi:Domain of unknown function (DUF6457)